MRKLSGLQWVIVLLTLATALIHIYLGATTWGNNSTMGALFVLDGIGYIVILALLYFSGRTGHGRSTMRWILILYTLLTLILYFVFNGSNAFSNTLGLITKAIEAVLIILLFLDRGNDREEVDAPAAVATTRMVETPVVVPTVGRSTTEVITPAAKVEAVAASAAVAAAAAAADADDEDDTDVIDSTPARVETRTAQPAGVSAEALATFFGDIDSMSPDEWRTKLMGHLALLGSTAQFEEPIEYVEGIGDVRGRKWRAVNITKVIDMLVYGATRKGRTALAKRSGFDESQILTWANQVDLYRIVGVGKQYGDLLEQSGVDTVVELARRNAQNLYKAMVVANEQKKLVRRTPALSEVESWIEQAKTLPRVMHY